MADIAPELLQRILRLFESGVGANPATTALWEMNDKTYREAFRYAEILGENAGRALGMILTNEALPDGRLYFNIAQKTVRPTMEQLQAMVADYCAAVQETINQKAGIGIAAIRPQVNEYRLKDLIDKISDAEKIEDLGWMFKAPVVNFSQAVVVDSVRENAEFQQGAGLAPKLIRSQAGKCCDWCDALLGVYDYAEHKDKGDDIYRRHDNCNCTLDYVPGDGSRKGAWGSRVGGLTAYTEWKNKKAGR